jgi:peptidoglycan/xylan/chitin deacetylase (PgdA/CDA1 family)
VPVLNSSDGGVAGRATVIAYHAVGDCPRAVDRENLFVSAESFAAQMRYLARRRTVIPLESLVGGRLPPRRKAVAITFDDGFRNVLTVAAPILHEHGFTATVFVPTGFLGRRSAWYDIPSCEMEVMDESELLQLERFGIEIASHGHGHLDLEHATAAEAEADIAASVETLTALVGRPPRYLAYPWGRSSEATRQAVVAAGFDAAFSLDVPHDGRYAYARVGITGLDGLGTFALKTSGRYLALRRSPFLASAYSLVKPFLRGRRQAG